MDMAAITDLPTAPASRIIDATYEAVSRYGLARFTMEDVARRAGLSRQSLYRYFDSKDALIEALVYREEERLLDGIRAVYVACDKLEEAVLQSVLFCLEGVRRHPLLDRTLEQEPEALLPYLTTRAAGLIEHARQVFEELLGQRIGESTGLLRPLSDLMVRTVMSHALTPGAERPEEIAGGVARVVASSLRLGGRQP
ncbi:MAG: TetR/AcrR family transcriptional regulator [Acidimicrobiia bacterium]